MRAFIRSLSSGIWTGGLHLDPIHIRKYTDQIKSSFIAYFVRCLFEDFEPYIKYIHFSEFGEMAIERDFKKGEYVNSNSASNKKTFTGISIKSQKM